MRCNGPLASAITDVPKFETMDPYQSNTDGLLALLSDYGTTATSTDLLNLLAGWPSGTAQQQQQVQTGGYTPFTTQQQQTQVQSPPPGPTVIQSQAPPQQQQPGNTTGNQIVPQTQSLSIKPLQIVGIVAVVVAVYLVTRKR